MNTFRAIKLIPWCALSLAKEFLDSWLLALHIRHETMKFCLKWSRCGTHVLHVRCLKAIASTPKLAALQRRHYWKKNYVVVSHVAMFSQVRILALPLKCHEKGKILFFFSKIWIFTFSHVSIFDLPYIWHAKLLSHVFAMAIFWTLKIALQQGKSHVCGNPVWILNNLVLWNEIAILIFFQ